MKKSFFISILLMIGLCGANTAKAQVADTMLVPFGCFEQWNDYPADTLSLMGMPIPLNEGYSLPEGWAIPHYNINETIPNFNIPISVSLPLAVVKEDSLTAPQGHSGLVAQSFYFSDVLTSTAYTLAQSFLDPDMLTTVLPSIVSTGTVDINKLLEFMDLITDNTSDLSWLLDIVDTADFNNYISGGFPLNGFQPNQLIGYYKYIYDHNFDRDNGVIVAFGTSYDTIGHRRMLVGAGSKRLFQLYDSVSYEHFEMDYFPIGDYLPNGYPFIEADSMVVLIISSASDKGFAYGSRLFVDSLRLVQFPGPCGRIENLQVLLIDETWVKLGWNNSETPDRWEVQYGPSGFTLGRGTTKRVSDSTCYIFELTPNTSYDFYVRGLCGDSAFTPWVFTTCTTDTLTIHGIAEMQESAVTLYPNPANGRCIVECGGTAVERLRLYSIDGRMVQDIVVKEDRFELLLPDTGIYIVELQTPQGLVHKRLVNK